MMSGRGQENRRSSSSRLRKGRARRANAICLASASLLTGVALVSAGVAEAQARLDTPEATVRPRSSFRPYLRLDEVYTDNAAVNLGPRRSDLITRALAGVTAQVNRGRLTASGRAEYGYDWYARNSGLNGETLYAIGSGAYTLVTDRLWIDADGTVAQTYASAFPTSAIDRAGTPGRTRLAIYRVGPRLSTRLGNFADVEAAARSQWVSYAARDSAAWRVPPDTNILQLLGRADTADRFDAYQLLTTGSVVRDDEGYRAANAVQSAYLWITPRTRLIGRAGYEQIRDRGVIDLHAPVMSAGFEFRPNATSRISIEGGERYKRTAWNARVDFRVANAVLVTGEYYETLSPSQVYVANSFERFVNQTKDLPAPVVPQNFLARENLYDQTSYNRAAEFRVVYSSTRQSLDLSSRWSRRWFIGTQTKDVTFSGSALYTRRIRTDFEVGLDTNYARTFDSPVYGEIEAYGVSWRALYRLNSTTDVNASYHYTHSAQLVAGGAKTRENLVRISIEKRF